MFDIFDDLFDMNNDGKLDSFEETAAFAMMASLMDEAESNDESNDDRDVFGEAGLDYDELEMMDPEEREDVLEAAGLDPFDFDF